MPYIYIPYTIYVLICTVYIFYISYSICINNRRNPYSTINIGGMADIFSDEQSDDDTEKHKASLIEKQSLISAYYVDITKHCRELLGADLPKNGKKALQKFLTE